MTGPLVVVTATNGLPALAKILAVVCPANRDITTRDYRRLRAVVDSL